MPPSILFLRILPVLVSMLILSGCAAVNRKPLTELRVSLTDLQVLEVKPLEAVFGLSLRVMNPNDMDLDIRGIRCVLKVDGRDFATGLSSAQTTVPAFGTALLPVTAYASTLSMFSSVMAMLQQDRRTQPGAEIRYQLDGTIRLGKPVNRAVDFSSSGALSLDSTGSRP